MFKIKIYVNKQINMSFVRKRDVANEIVCVKRYFRRARKSVGNWPEKVNQTVIGLWYGYDSGCNCLVYFCLISKPVWYAVKTYYKWIAQIKFMKTWKIKLQSSSCYEMAIKLSFNTICLQNAYNALLHQGFGKSNSCDCLLMTWSGLCYYK